MDAGGLGLDDYEGDSFVVIFHRHTHTLHNPYHEFPQEITILFHLIKQRQKASQKQIIRNQKQDIAKNGIK